MKALHWIVGILRRREIKYQVVGGLAVPAYGGTRPLLDIDRYVPGERLEEIAQDAGTYLTFAPKYEISESWDITLWQCSTTIRK